MWHKIVLNYFILLSLPTFMRKPITAAFAQALLKPLDLIYYDWTAFRADNLYKIEHTWQKCYMRGALNDKFDINQRRIRIGKGQINEPQYIFTEVEDQTVYIDDTLWLWTDSETADTGLDFIVYITQELYDTQHHAIRAMVDFYRLGGKRYDILIEE